MYCQLVVYLMTLYNIDVLSDMKVIYNNQTISDPTNKMSTLTDLKKSRVRNDRKIRCTYLQTKQIKHTVYYKNFHTIHTLLCYCGLAIVGYHVLINRLDTLKYRWLSARLQFITRWAMNTGWWEINIHGCYSLVTIAFAPRTIDEYDVTMLIRHRSTVVTSQC